jgi:hypothetical protein
VFSAALLVLAFALPSMAALDNQRTKVTFSQPVEVPGMALPAGDYIFEVVDSSMTNSIVQIRRADGEEPLTTVLAIPNKRLTVSEDTEFRFYETAPDTPPAVRVWFYPSLAYGHELVYPEARARQLAQESGRAVASSSDSTYNAKPAGQEDWTALRETHIFAVTPSGEETDTETAASENQKQDQKMWNVYHYYSVEPVDIGQ